MPIPHSWFHRLNSLPANRNVPIVRTNFLFLPIDAALQLLDTSTPELWKSIRQTRPGLPVWKSVKGLFAFEFPSLTQNLIDKFQRNAPDEAPVLRLVSKGLSAKFFWPAHPGWAGLFQSSLFRHDRAKLFWGHMLEEAYLLNTQRYRASGIEPFNVFTAYNTDPTTLRLGCPLSREIIAQRLATCGPDIQQLDPAISQAFSADLTTVLVRICAWLMADKDAATSDRIIGSLQDSAIPLLDSVPKFDAVSQTWNSPIAAQLKSLARAAGKQHLVTSSFLARLWISPDQPDKQLSTTRLIRNWEQEKGGRPTFDSLLAVSKAVVEKLAAGRTYADEKMVDEYRYQAQLLRLAETMGYVRRELTAAKFPIPLIEAIFAVYETEYRLAREAVGKPICAAD